VNILRKKTLFNLSSDGESKLKKTAFDMGYLEYGSGGLKRFVDDLLRYCVEENNEILISFKHKK
jgi:hypothetical protein